MSTIEQYGFEDSDGNPDTFTTFNPHEARDYARKYGLRWIAYIYEFSDSELIEDNTHEEPT